MDTNTREKHILDRLEALPIDEARKAIATKQFGDIGSRNHNFCLAWLSVKEAELRNDRESSTLFWARHAALAAYVAAILTAISITINIIGH